MRELQFIAMLDKKQFSLRTRATIVPGQSSLLHDVLKADAQPASQTATAIALISNMAAMVRDPSLVAYLRLLTARLSQAQLVVCVINN